MNATILEGDCVEVMGAMADNSIDAIVCDPPYGLEFMGKEWDRLGATASAFGESLDENGKVDYHGKGNAPFGGGGQRVRYGTNARKMQAWHEAWAREALRVLKPGGHMLAFSGTRTYHRLACAVEDAGFEIRDTIQWIYGSGFPKSLNVGKAIDKMGAANISWFGPWLRKERKRRGITQKELAQHFPSKTGGLTGCVANWELGLNTPTVEQFNVLCDVLGLPFSRLEEAEREVVGKSPHGFGPNNGASLTHTMQAHPDITAPATDEAKQWDGWGSALKPAHEPIVLARKPLSESSIARQVLSTGTGAINVDGGRVGTPDSTVRPNGPIGYHGGGSGGVGGGTSGRFPANLIFSHSPDCVQVGERRVKPGNGSGKAHGQNTSRGNLYLYGIEGEKGSDIGGFVDPDGMETVEAWECVDSCPVWELDRHSGTLRARGNVSPTKRQRGSWFGAEGNAGPTDSGTQGGASRFFYVAKSSRRERNAGLEGMPEEFMATMNSGIGKREHSTDEPRAYTQNTHPTVKPIALMRYLCRLITPPGGTVLDPFAGSGSTGCAAVLEGFDFVGIERESEYAEIARRRIDHWHEEADRTAALAAEVLF